MLLFVYVFGGAIARSLPHGVAYVDFLLPGILVQSVTFGASQTAVGLKEDLQRGVVDRFRSMPMARSAVLAGRTVADLVRNVLVIGLMIAVGYLVGFRFLGGVAGAVACVAVVAAFGLMALPADQLSRGRVELVCVEGQADGQHWGAERFLFGPGRVSLVEGRPTRSRQPRKGSQWP